MTEVSVTSGHNAVAHLKGTTNEHGVYLQSFTNSAKTLF